MNRFLGVFRNKKVKIIFVIIIAVIATSGAIFGFTTYNSNKNRAMEQSKLVASIKTGKAVRGKSALSIIDITRETSPWLLTIYI